MLFSRQTVDTLDVNKRYSGKTKSYSPPRFTTRELKQQRRQRERKRHLRINIWENGDYFVIIASSSHPLLLREHVANGLVETPLK